LLLQVCWLLVLLLQVLQLVVFAASIYTVFLQTPATATAAQFTPCLLPLVIVQRDANRLH
jgi:hypothetical protein